MKTARRKKTAGILWRVLIRTPEPLDDYWSTVRARTADAAVALAAPVRPDSRRLAIHVWPVCGRWPKGARRG